MNLLNKLIVLFVIVSLFEIIAEYFAEKKLVYLFKPLLVPVLGLIYFKSAKKIDNYYVIGLFFAWLANIFYISTDLISLEIASIFFLIFRMIVLYIVLKSIAIKKYFPIIIGSIPFLVIFFYITCLTIDELGEGVYIYILQGMLISFLGGLSLSNYIMNSEKRTSFWLFLSTFLFAINMYLVVIKLFYSEISIFQPILMLLHIVAQYSLYKFMISDEI